MIIAEWFNTDKTKGARLWENGVLELMERGNPGQMWSPPKTLGLTNVNPLLLAVLTLTPSSTVKII